MKSCLCFIKLTFAACIWLFSSCVLANQTEQGFVVDAGSEVSVTIDSNIYAGKNLAARFSKRRDGEFDYYIALPGVFRGSEVIIVNAYYVDAAGNRSQHPSTVKIDPINTSLPKSPTVKNVVNSYSTKYSKGFTVNAGAHAKVYINGIEVTGVNLFDWFDRQNKGHIDEYIAKKGLFEGNEEVIVVASAIDNWGNVSKPSDPVKLPSIDTTSPDSPKIRSLAKSSSIIQNAPMSYNRVPTRILNLSELPNRREAKAKPVVKPPLRPVDTVMSTQEVFTQDDHIDEIIDNILNDSSDVAPVLLLDDALSSKARSSVKTTSKKTNKVSKSAKNNETASLKAASKKAISPVLNSDEKAEVLLASKNTLDPFQLLKVPLKEETARTKAKPKKESKDAAMTIGNVIFANVFDDGVEPSSEFVASIEGRPFDLQDHQNALKRLERIGIISDASFDYFPTSNGTYDVELKGRVNSSHFGVGASYTGDGKLIGMFKGKHLFDFYGVRYLDYQLGSDIDGRFDFSLETPLHYNINNQTNLSVHSTPQEFPYFKSRNSGADIAWHRDNFSLLGKELESNVYLDISRTELAYKDSLDDITFNDRASKLYSIGATLLGRSVISEGDNLSAGLTINSVDGDFYEGEFSQFDIDYRSNWINLFENTGFEVNTAYSVIGGSLDAVPIEQRLYLGGPKTLRGVVPNFIGSKADVDSSGGDRRFYLQLELSRNLDIFGHKMNLGVHYDVGQLMSKETQQTEKASSFGVFAKTKFNHTTEGYVFFSKADVDSDGKAPIGIALVQRF